MRRRRPFRPDRRGAALVECALLVAGVAVVAVVAGSVLGHETSDLLGTAAAVIPGAHGEENAPVVSGELLETASDGDGILGLDVQRIVDRTGEERLGDNLGYAPGDLPGLIVHPDE